MSIILERLGRLRPSTRILLERAAVDKRQRVSSGSPFEDQIGFCRALRIGDRVLVAGTAPISGDGEVEPEAGAQARLCLEIILGALEGLGADAADVVRTRMYLIDPADAEAVGAVHGEVFRQHRPVSTILVVAALLDPRWRVEIEAEAIVGPN